MRQSVCKEEPESLISNKDGEARWALTHILVNPMWATWAQPTYADADKSTQPRMKSTMDLTEVFLASIFYMRNLFLEKKCVVQHVLVLAFALNLSETNSAIIRTISLL